MLFSLIYSHAKERSAESIYIDSLYVDVYMNFSTVAGLQKVDRLIEEIKRIDSKNKTDKYVYVEYSALCLKAGSYLNLGMYRNLESLMDSVDTYSDMASRIPRDYSYLKYVMSISYNQQGKHRLAMKIAQELYDNSLDYLLHPIEMTDNNSQYTIPVSVSNRISALMCLGQANCKMGNIENALKYYDECIEVVNINPVALCGERRDVYSERVVAVLKSDDNKLKLKYIEELAQVIDEYRKLDYKFASIEDMQVYEMYMYDAYVNTYCAMKEYDKAGEAVVKMGEVFDRIEQARDNAASTYYTTLAMYYEAIGQYVKAIECADSAAYYNRGVEITGELEALRIKMSANHKAHFIENDYEIASHVLALADSMYIESKNASVEEMNTLLGIDKLKIASQEMEARLQMWIMGIVVTIVISISVIAIIILSYKRRREREKRKLLSEQNDRLEVEVANQTRELREKNQNITDSINYAQRIQSALLPDIESYGREGIEGAFSFFRPRDIVSGDFYWAHKRGDELMFVCSDCTGHGVPGAFMSMIGTTILNDICSRKGEIHPDEVLSMLDAQLIEALSQRDEISVNDGMDMVFVIYNTQTHVLSFSTARRPLYLVHNGVLEEYRGTKRSIGERDEASRRMPFESMSVVITPGDTVYFCSDGLADQFGGEDAEHPHGRRLKSAGLKKILADISQLPISEQKMAINSIFDKWKGNCYQVDDVALVGVRF